ncbi:hypothetical protein J2Z52_000423 [Enterococcus rivorum]|nr:hypothetical protein [Enterococcus rivorum]
MDKRLRQQSLWGEKLDRKAHHTFYGLSDFREISEEPDF